MKENIGSSMLTAGLITGGRFFCLNTHLYGHSHIVSGRINYVDITLLLCERDEY